MRLWQEDFAGVPRAGPPGTELGQHQRLVKKAEPVLCGNAGKTQVDGSEAGQTLAFVGDSQKPLLCGAERGREAVKAVPWSLCFPFSANSLGEALDALLPTELCAPSGRAPSVYSSYCPVYVNALLAC